MIGTIIRISVGGSACYLFYKLISLILVKRSGIHWQHYFINVILFLFIIPVADIFLTNAAYLPDLLIISSPNPVLRFLRDYSNVFLAIWLIGAVINLAWEYWCYHQYSRRISARSYALTDPAVISIYQSAREKIEVHRNISLYYNPDISTPQVTGLFKSRIFIPEKTISEKEFFYIFDHELTHLKQHDPEIKFLLLVLQGLHWFNPFFRFIIKDWNMWREYRCDDKVTSHLTAAEKQEYSMAILNSIDVLVAEDRFQMAFADDKSRVRMRLERILYHDKAGRIYRPVMSLLSIMLLCLYSVVGYAMYQVTDEIENYFEEDEIVFIEEEDYEETTDYSYFEEYQLTVEHLDAITNSHKVRFKKLNSDFYSIPADCIVYADTPEISAGQGIGIYKLIGEDGHITIGIIEADGTIRAVDAIDNIINYTFDLNENGPCQVFMINWEDYKNEIGGFITDENGEILE